MKNAETKENSQRRPNNNNAVIKHSTASSVALFVCSHFFEASFWNCGSLCHGQSGHHVVNLPPGGGFSIYKTAQRI